MIHRLPSTSNRGVLLLLLGSLALHAWAEDPAPAIRVGIHYGDVVAALGQPEKTSSNLFGMFQNLYYPNYKIILRRGVVVEVQERKPSPHPPAVAAPKPQAEAARTPEAKRPDLGTPEVASAQAPIPVPEVVPGPVPPKVAPSTPVPVAKPEPPPAPAPEPVARPTSNPVPPATLASPPAGPVAANGLDDMLAQGLRRVRAVPAGHWTLRLILARQVETVRNVPGFFKGEKPDLFVLSVPAPGGTLYHVFYGDFATREAAARKAGHLPAAFGHPAAFKSQKLRSLVAASEHR